MNASGIRIASDITLQVTFEKFPKFTPAFSRVFSNCKYYVQCKSKIVRAFMTQLFYDMKITNAHALISSAAQITNKR